MKYIPTSALASRDAEDSAGTSGTPNPRSMSTSSIGPGVGVLGPSSSFSDARLLAGELTGDLAGEAAFDGEPVCGMAEVVRCLLTRDTLGVTEKALLKPSKRGWGGGAGGSISLPDVVSSDRAPIMGAHLCL